MAELLPYGIETARDPVSIEAQEIAEAVREIKAWLAAGDTWNALQMCEQMLSSHPGNKLFAGLKLEVDDRERAVRLEFIRKLTSDLESLDFDARIDAIQQALKRYPAESQLSQLLRNATARRDLFNSVIVEARNEELSDRYDESLKRWYLLRELYPAMPWLENEIRRIEALSDSQRRMKRRAAFVDAIFRLSSTGDYTGAIQQCVGALTEYPNDGGLLALKKTVEEKAQHVTEIQGFLAEGLTFLKGQETDAALESFAKAKAFDQSNLQIRYLIGIALLEKARVLMTNDRRKLNMLLDEAKSLMPNEAGLNAVSFLEAPPDDRWEESLVRIEHSESAMAQDIAQPPAASPPVDVVAQPPAAPPPVDVVPQPPAPLPPFVVDPKTSTDKPAARPIATPAPKPTSIPKPAQPLTPAPPSEALRKVAIAGVVLIGVLLLAWFVFANRPASAGAPAAAPHANVEITATPEGVEIFIDGEKAGESQAQRQLTPGVHTVSASLAGYESQTMPLEFGSGSKALKIELQPTLLDLHIASDQPGAAVWMDDQSQGEVTEGGLTISGIQPGVRILKMQTPDGETEISFEFRPGEIPTLKSSPSPQSTKVLFVGSASGKSRVECNCVPAGLRVGKFAELIEAGGLEVPLSEGQNPAELWLGRNKRNLTIHGSSRSPVATIAMFSSTGTVRAKEIRIETAAVDQGHQGR